ncbi:rod shape-determining protein MreD [Ichthyenterobacterium sp. W332]|uniref:Rod shape-determining protein MreD n=1 Tax=Microcosmobacter mediterraneus TaxID=3075607 RepID=A0ABU2YN19_9FLAO|nr:rod shape-determining protein MreD [Ichthyenterobacterium sp. W332]MDT0559217.1 rod shape-determining protein MreD [Ichthyenterobacterium sp. W332]
MNSLRLNIVLRFVVLVLMQVILFNRIDFLGYINPFVYIIFILSYPVNNNRVLFLISTFLLGLTIDIFSDSGGVHAAACVCIAYLRPVVLKFSFGTLYEHQTIKFSNMEFGSLFGYISILTFTHHLVLFSLEIFNMSQILLILQKTLFSGVFTMILSLLIILLFSPKSK